MEKPLTISKGAKGLTICIIGAGIGGLTCALALAKAGHTDIRVFEHASDLGFVGAGIQLAPNMARILDRLGVWQEIEQQAVVLDETSIRNGTNDQELTHVDLRYIKEIYGYPHMVGHRSSLVNALFNGCKRHDSIQFNFSTTIQKIKTYSPRPVCLAVPRNGDNPYEVDAGVILSADGVKSIVRVGILEELGLTAKIQDTGQAAYRIMLSQDQMSHDPDLLELIKGDKVTRWIGERRHIIAYPVAAKSIYNISTAQPDDNFAAAPSATYTTKGSKSAMLATFDDFCPLVQRMLSLIPEGEVCEWKLRVHAPLPAWVHGSVALIGDSCHPTLPHLAQGAAQAIEDAAVLGVILARIPDQAPSTINAALRLYEEVRKSRAELLVDLAAASGKVLHLGEGKAKEDRDKAFAASKSGSGPIPDKWADASVQKMIYGFDCIKAAEDACKIAFG